MAGGLCLIHRKSPYESIRFERAMVPGSDLLITTLIAQMCHRFVIGILLLGLRCSLPFAPGIDCALALDLVMRTFLLEVGSLDL